jgi:hypothetical protein
MTPTLARLTAGRRTASLYFMNTLPLQFTLALSPAAADLVPLDGFGRAWLCKMLYEKFPAQGEALLRENDRLCFSDRIVDHSFLVQPIHHIPIQPFPCAAAVMQRQEEHRKRHLIDFIFIVVHGMILSLSPRRCNASLFVSEPCISCQPSNQAMQRTAGRSAF